MVYSPGFRRLRTSAAVVAAGLSLSLLLVSPVLAKPAPAGGSPGGQLPAATFVRAATSSTPAADSTSPDETTAGTTTVSTEPTGGTTTDSPTSDPTTGPTTSVTTTRPPEQPGPDAPLLDWTACRDGFECAKAVVPLDYDKPFGASITLSLIRLTAADPAQRIGSLFVNPGGPGGSGVDVVRGVGKSLPLELRARYDLIGFDPRGVMRSTPLRCFDTLAEALGARPPIAFPVTADDETVWRASDQALASACAARGGAIGDHMSTANVARDLDLLRRAVGDEQLNYLGFSYGSYLGVTYANLFPDKVGALVVDGVLNPVAWATGTGDESATLPFTTRLGSDAGSSSTLGEFFRLCDSGGSDCAFAPNSQARYAALAARLLEHPIELQDPLGSVRVTYADLVAITLGALYAPIVWPDLAGLLAAVEAPSVADVRQHLASLSAALGVHTAVQEDYPNVVESFAGVACGETDNPARYQAWAPAAAAADERNPYFGRLWTWDSSVCQPWPGQDADRYAGPWTAATANTVLVVGNSFDPATPYAGAQKVAELLPNSTLLTYAGWGHTAFGSGNYCIDSNVVAYLITRQPPAAGTVCQPDGSPFGPLAAQRTQLAEQAASSMQAALVPDILRRAISVSGVGR